MGEATCLIATTQGPQKEAAVHKIQQSAGHVSDSGGSGNHSSRSRRAFTCAASTCAIDKARLRCAACQACPAALAVTSQQPQQACP